MCRLFGFRSNVPARVHQELVYERNSLRAQSVEHKDGWGIASYVDGPLPELAHGVGAAHRDPEFERVSNLVSSRAVIAHVRLASVGPVALQNAHPFNCGKWTFAHNGTLQRFDVHRADLEAQVDPDFRALIRGDTDSERCFYLFLSLLRRRGGLEDPRFEDVARALARTTHIALQITEVGATKPSSTNFIVTDGRQLLATRRHRTLFYTERRPIADCPEPPACEGRQLRQFIVASEILDPDAHWYDVPENSLVGVAPDLTFRQFALADLARDEAAAAA
jgi:predicted glutamine amidotransferase